MKTKCIGDAPDALHYEDAHSMLRLWLSCCVAATLTLTSVEASAWYFPEHAVVTNDAVDRLPPEVRMILSEAIKGARREGLPLCEKIEVGLSTVSRTRPLKTRLLRAEKGVDCIPFSVLPALAGDHASSVAELRAVVINGKAAEVTTAAAYQWGRFLTAVDKLPNKPIERMSFVHALDVDFYYIDPGYEVRASATRAHFVDAGRTLGEVVRNAGLAGAVDNATAEFVTHHLRSLELAAHGSNGEALLEHGLALHFLQDSFSAGHLVVSDWFWARGNTHIRHRHDYFDAKGLRVRRALSAESCASLRNAVEASGGLLPCWSTTGDGYLSIGEDASDRLHLARAIEKAELELALAFDPERVLSFVERIGEREQIAFGQLLDPMPWWTLAPSSRRKRSDTARHAMALVRGAARAALELSRAPVIRAVAIGAPSSGPLFDKKVVRDALAPCRDDSTLPEADRPPSPAVGLANQPDDIDPDGCGEGRGLALGTVGTSLLRPLLVELPVAEEDDLKNLEGQALTDHGFAFQLFGASGGTALFGPRSPVDFFAPTVEASAGFAYRFGTYLPGRQNRPVIELNAGIGVGLHYDARRRAGGNPFVTMLSQEIRWPILWELLTSYVRPFDLRASHSAGSLIFFGGLRSRELLGETPRLFGIELEVAAVEIVRGLGAYPLYGGSLEARFHVGFADPSAAQPSFPSVWGPTFGLSVTTGYSTFL